MKKFLNSVDTMLTESLDGFVAAHSDTLMLGGGHKFVRRKVLKPGKVALLSGGGSGHEPLHAGFVGHGMLDAACPGQVFTSPTPDQMAEAIAEIDTGAGVLLIVKNYEGDVMNFEMAGEISSGRIERVVTNDDAAVENSLYTTGRRGVAGTVVVEKIAGAAAEAGRDLEAVKAVSERVNAATRSMGVALTLCTVPAAGKPMFEIGGDEMEFGVGIHGEPGRRRDKLKSADAIAAEICEAIVGDLGDVKGKPALLFVNGLGGTPLMELYLMYNSALPGPAIDPNYLAEPEDLAKTVDSVRLGRRIMAQPSLNGYLAREHFPGPDFDNQADLEAFVRAQARTGYHPAGTCRMGTDDRAVVDTELRVKGVDRLRIADNSIMPRLVSANTNATAIMIGERAAHFIKGNA